MINLTTEKAKETLSTVLEYTHIDCDYGYDNADGSVKLVPGKDIAEALDMAIQALRAQQERENPRPLTLEELREMDGPVWCECKPIEGGNGFWCLCKKGRIIAAGGSRFHIDEIPHWVFLRNKPKEGRT